MPAAARCRREDVDADQRPAGTERRLEQGAPPCEGVPRGVDGARQIPIGRFDQDAIRVQPLRHRAHVVPHTERHQGLRVPRHQLRAMHFQPQSLRALQAGEDLRLGDPVLPQHVAAHNLPDPSCHLAAPTAARRLRHLAANAGAGYAATANRFSPAFPRSFLVRIPGAVVVAVTVCAADIGILYAAIADIAISALRLR
jgi:hypothetical protein